MKPMTGMFVLDFDWIGFEIDEVNQMKVNFTVMKKLIFHSVSINISHYSRPKPRL